MKKTGILALKVLGVCLLFILIVISMILIIYYPIIDRVGYLCEYYPNYSTECDL